MFKNTNTNRRSAPTWEEDKILQNTHTYIYQFDSFNETLPLRDISQFDPFIEILPLRKKPTTENTP